MHCNTFLYFFYFLCFYFKCRCIFHNAAWHVDSIYIKCMSYMLNSDSLLIKRKTKFWRKNKILNSCCITTLLTQIFVINSNSLKQNNIHRYFHMNSNIHSRIRSFYLNSFTSCFIETQQLWITSNIC